MSDKRSHAIQQCLYIVRVQQTIHFYCTIDLLYLTKRYLTLEVSKSRRNIYRTGNTYVIVTNTEAKRQKLTINYESRLVHVLPNPVHDVFLSYFMRQDRSRKVNKYNSTFVYKPWTMASFSFKENSLACFQLFDYCEELYVSTDKQR